MNSGPRGSAWQGVDQPIDLEINLGKNLIGCKGGNFWPDTDAINYLKVMKNKKFDAKSLITNEIILEDINESGRYE